VSGSPDVQLSVSAPVSPEVLQALRADVVSAIEDGATAITIDVDDAGVLDSPLIAALISILRDAREHGVSVSLHATGKNILETLHVTALERVFRIVSDTGDQAVPAPPPPARKWRNGRALAAVAGALFALGSMFGTPASGAPEPSASDVVTRVLAQNAGMQSYSARVSIDVALRSFPYFSQQLSGTEYYKRPDNFEIVFDHVPSYAKGFDKIYDDVDDPTAWQRRFSVSLVGASDVLGHRDLVLRLVQKVRGMIDHEDVAVDPASWHVDSMEWHYYNGGTIAMTQEYQTVGGYSVLSKQHATIRIPFLHAGADAVYDDYKPNVAIDDSVFVGKKN
jgi:anti-anti-sigma regulatory factor